MISEELKRRVIRNHELRQGKSVMPLAVFEMTEHVTRVYDPETSGWSDWSHFGANKRGLYSRISNPTGVKVSFYDEKDPNA